MKTSLFILSFIALMLGTVLYMVFPAVAPYIFSVGAAGVIGVRLSSPYEGSDFRIKRLHTMQNISTLLYIAVAYFMFIQSAFWVVLLLVAAIAETVVAFRMPKENKE